MFNFVQNDVTGQASDSTGTGGAQDLYGRKRIQLRDTGFETSVLKMVSVEFG